MTLLRCLLIFDIRVMAIQKYLDLDQILAPGYFFVQQLFIFPLCLAVELILLGELGEDLVLDHVADLLLAVV